MTNYQQYIIIDRNSVNVTDVEWRALSRRMRDEFDETLRMLGGTSMWGQIVACECGSMYDKGSDCDECEGQ